MGLLQDLLSGGNRRQEYEDFANRYDQGQPWEGISDQEAASRYREVANELSDDEYMEAAQEAFSRLSPEQRRQFARQLNSQAGQRNNDFVDRDFDGQDDRYEDPRELARMTRQMQRRDPDLLTQMIGGGRSRGDVTTGGSALDNPIAKAAVDGIAAMAFKRIMGNRR